MRTHQDEQSCKNIKFQLEGDETCLNELIFVLRRVEDCQATMIRLRIKRRVSWYELSIVVIDLPTRQSSDHTPVIVNTRDVKAARPPSKTTIFSRLWRSDWRDISHSSSNVVRACGRCGSPSRRVGRHPTRYSNCWRCVFTCFVSRSFIFWLLEPKCKYRSCGHSLSTHPINFHLKQNIYFKWFKWWN